jgi:hypothetical protein
MDSELLFALRYRRRRSDMAEPLAPASELMSQSSPAMDILFAKSLCGVFMVLSRPHFKSKVAPIAITYCSQQKI